MLWSGFLKADHRKQYLPIRSPIPIFLKPSFYHVELFMLMIQSRFLDIYSGPEFHFLKWIPLLGDSCEGDFLIWGVEGGHFLDIFLKYIFISPKCLIMHCIFVLTIIQLLHNSLHTAEAWFHELYVRWPTQGSHILRLQCVCSQCAVHTVSGAEAALTVLSHRSLQLIHGLLQTQHLSIILISNPNIVTSAVKVNALITH